MTPERQEKVKKENHALVYTVLQDGQILLEKRLDPKKKYYGQNYLPARGVKRDEFFNLSLDKILKDEYDCLPRTTYFIGEYTHQYASVNYKRYLFLVVEIYGKITIKDSDKYHRFWASLDEARTLCRHPHTQEFLTDIEDFLAGKD